MGSGDGGDQTSNSMFVGGLGLRCWHDGEAGRERSFEERVLKDPGVAASGTAKAVR